MGSRWTPRRSRQSPLGKHPPISTTSAHSWASPTSTAGSLMGTHEWWHPLSTLLVKLSTSNETPPAKRPLQHSSSNSRQHQSFDTSPLTAKYWWKQTPLTMYPPESCPSVTTAVPCTQ